MKILTEDDFYEEDIAAVIEQATNGTWEYMSTDEFLANLTKPHEEKNEDK